MPTLSENLIRSLLTKRQKPEDIDRFRSIAAQAVDPSVDINTLPSPFEQEGTGVNRFLKGVFGVPTSSELNQSFFQQAAQARVPFQTEKLKQEGEAKQARLGNILKLSEQLNVLPSALESPTVGQTLLERLLATTGKETEEAKLGSDVATQLRGEVRAEALSRADKRELARRRIQALLNIGVDTDLTSPESSLMFATPEGNLPVGVLPDQMSDIERQVLEGKVENLGLERELAPLLREKAQLEIEAKKREAAEREKINKLVYGDGDQTSSTASELPQGVTQLPGGAIISQDKVITAEGKVIPMAEFEKMLSRLGAEGTKG